MFSPPGRDGALRRPRRVQRRNGSARYCAGGDIAARCPYQRKVRGKPRAFSSAPWAKPRGSVINSRAEGLESGDLFTFGGGTKRVALKVNVEKGREALLL